MRIRGALAAAVAWSLATASLGAQGPGARAPGAPVPGATIRISVLTIGQGDLVFENFGHNALRVQDPSIGLDIAYNWGSFSFEQPRFIRRFLSGDTQYWVEGIATDRLVQAYVFRDREIHEQELNLTPAQRTELAALAAENALEANKYYRYDYFRDNCSTRLRDILDTVLGGSLERSFSPLRTSWTYRSEAVRLTAPSRFPQAGIDVALGQKADVQLTAWEAMFIPMRLRDYLRDVTVAGPDGRAEPLVLDERLLYRAQRAPELPERRGLALGAWGPVLGAWMLLLAPVSAASRRRSRIPAAVMAFVWYALVGVIGLLVLAMWVGSAHVFWYNNLNLLIVSPLGLVAAYPVARAVFRGSLDLVALGLLTALTAMAVIALVIAPFVSQRLGGPLLLFLPAQLGLAVAVWRHTRPVAAAA
ncbi:MAG: DUF4105 domain-containing protein [Gemmatimonadaceae bacterium]